MTSKASVLVCNDPRSVSHEKLRHASEWGVPAVSGDWLWGSIKAGQKKSFEPYIIKKQSSQGDKSSEKQEPSHKNHSIQQENPDQDFKARQANTGDEAVEIKENTPDLLQENDVENQSKHTNNDKSPKERQHIPQKRPSVSQSRSPSPRKEQNHQTTKNSVQRQESDQSTASAAQSAFDLAVNGFLRQAREANSRQASDSGEKSDNVRQRRRKPLLGRAPSHSSAHGFSRASSIDTLNEDGCGSGIESAPGTRANSRAGHSFNSLLSGGIFEFGGEDLPRVNEAENEEQEPPMTQLNYEDPDAVAMRQQFLQHAGKLVDEKKPQDSQRLVIGEVRELEDVGWGTGRRTRKAATKPTDDLEY